MPELPEVETVRISLEPLIRGCRIQAIRPVTPGVLIDWIEPNFPGRAAAGLRVTTLRRRGKYLLIDLEADLLLVVHLRMTGQFSYQDPPQPLIKHDHVVFLLERTEANPGKSTPDALDSAPVQLVFHDTRRFGRIWLLHKDQLEQIRGLHTLGPEPHDPSLTGTILRQRLKRHARLNLKAALLDQTVLAGLGNIYADESLYLAGLNPNRLAGSLTREESERLLACLREILIRAVHARGTSVKDYVDALNVRGSFQYQLQVYGRAGQVCNRCDQPLSKTVLGGRTTVYCPACQPLKRRSNRAARSLVSPG